MGDWVRCPECNGSGFEDEVIEYAAGRKVVYAEPCRSCRGVKEIYQEIKCHDGQQ